MAIKSNLDTGGITPQRLEFLLPSLGLLYKSKKLGKTGFPSTITVSPFSFVTEGILNSNGVSFEKMRDVAKIVIRNFPPDFDWDAMLVGDLTVTLALARALTYGESYTFDSECPACGHPEHHTIKIPEELPVRTWKTIWENPDPVTALAEHQTVVLPHCRDKIRLRALTVADEIAQQNMHAKVGEGSAVVVKGAGGPLADLPEPIQNSIIRVARLLVSVNGTTPDDLHEAAAYIRRLEGSDKVKLEDFLPESTCGIKYDWTVVCDECQTRYKSVVPISSHFFRRNRE